MGKRNNEFACIVDPAADHGNAQHRWPFFKEKLFRLISDSPVYFCSPEKFVEEFIETIIQESYKSILVAGDDRTINRIANKLMQYDKAERPRLGLLCASGTRQSIFNSNCPEARFMSNQERLEACVNLIMRRTFREIDLGKVEFVGSKCNSQTNASAPKNASAPQNAPTPQYFVNLATFGISSFIYDRLGGNAAALHSGLAYVAAAAKSLLSYDPPQITLRVGTRLMAKNEEIFNLFIANGQFGPGGMILNEKGSLSDGKFHALMIPELTVNEVFTELPKLWMREKDLSPSISLTGKTFRLQCSSPDALSRINLDGIPALPPPAIIQVKRSAISLYG